jgi:hypothetical protein
MSGIRETQFFIILHQKNSSARERGIHSFVLRGDIIRGRGYRVVRRSWAEPKEMI